MEIDSEGSAQEVPHGESSGSEQERLQFTWTGFERGYIKAEVHHDWSQKGSVEGSDLIPAVSKKASVPATAWDVIDLDHGVVDEEWEDGAPRTNVFEQ